MKKFAGLLVIVLAVSFGFSGCAKKGEALWTAACEHAMDVAKAEAKKAGDKEEPKKEEMDKAMKDCTDGFKALGDGADEAATCVAAVKDMKGVQDCMVKAMEKKAKGGDKKKEEKKEEKK